MVTSIIVQTEQYCSVQTINDAWGSVVVQLTFERVLVVIDEGLVVAALNHDQPRVQLSYFSPQVGVVIFQPVDLGFD